MRKPSLAVYTPAVLLSVCLLIPFDLVAQNQAQSQAARSAGKVSRMIPAVNLQRGAKVSPASTAMAVLWGDTLTTDRGGRARVALDDGSILNVGSDSSIRVVSHDAAAQRTQIQLAYGRLRSSAVRLARAGSSFEVRTPTAVAGVVGTDFFMAFENNISRLIVFEGKVNFCNLAGQCVTVGAGMTSAVRANESPNSPSPTPPSESITASNSSSVGGGPAGGGATGGAAGGAGGGAGGAAGAAGVSVGALAGHGVLMAVGVVAAAVVPAVVVTATVGKGHHCGSAIVVAGRPPQFPAGCSSPSRRVP
jgi:hypothetical protein